MNVPDSPSARWLERNSGRGRAGKRRSGIPLDHQGTGIPQRL